MVFVGGELLGVNEFGLEVFDIVIIEVEAAFQCPVGDAFFVLQQLQHTGQGLVICHRLTSSCTDLRRDFAEQLPTLLYACRSR